MSAAQEQPPEDDRPEPGRVLSPDHRAIDPDWNCSCGWQPTSCTIYERGRREDAFRSHAAVEGRSPSSDEWEDELEPFIAEQMKGPDFAYHYGRAEGFAAALALPLWRRVLRRGWLSESARTPSSGQQP